MQDLADQASSGGTTPSKGAAEAPPKPLTDANALLQEVDHRVKNNLQLISSLILLQSRRTEDPAARQALRTVLERVNAVTTVHRRLFKGDVQRFDVADFVRDLCGDLAAAAGRSDIEVSLRLEHVEIPASSAAAFALIVNELLGNALRHAFPPDRAGGVTITITQDAAHCVLTLADDGVGLSDRPPGFGLTIVRLLTQQLHADLEFPGLGLDRGTKAVLRVPLELSVRS